MKKIICAIMLLMLFVACSEDVTDSSVQIGGDESVTPSITLNQTSINFNDHAGTQEITFNSTMAWTAELINERADGWCSISTTGGSAGSGRINVTVTENTTPDDRTASVIIKSGTISRTVRISQKQRDALTVTASTFEVESTKGKIYIEVKANIDFEYTINGSAAEWITPIQTRALKTTTLGFNIAENNISQRREGTITIHSGDFQEVVTVYQAGSDKTILLSKKEFVISNEGDVISIDVTSNVDVELEMPDVDWITRNVSRAVSTNTYYFTVAENATYDQREAYITFKNTEKKITERVKVTQIQKDAIVLAQSIYYIEQEGGALDFEVQTNVDLQVTVDEDAQSWITHVATRGLRTKTLHFDIAPYNGYATREGTIKISGGGTSQAVTMCQKSNIAILDTPKSNEIYYTTNDKEIASPSLSYSSNIRIVSNIYDQAKGYGIITFNQNIEEIENDAFLNCGRLTNIIIPDDVTAIGNYAFMNTSLRSITISNNVTAIGSGVFQGCYALKNVYCKAITPPTLKANVFDNKVAGRKIYVPTSAVDAYKSAPYWSDYADDIVADETEETNDSYQGTLPILNKKEVASKLLSEWDKGGEGVGYHDSLNSNGGTPDVEGAGNIGYTTSGEWLAYTVYVADAGTYRFTLYGSSSDASGTYGGEYQWFLNDPYVEENALGPRFKQQSGGGWGGPWMPSEPVEFELNEGFQRIILYMHNGAHNLYNFTAEWAE